MRRGGPPRPALMVAVLGLGLWLAGCSGASGASGGSGSVGSPGGTPATGAAPSASATPTAPALALGDAQEIEVASAFGPGTGDVRATITVLGVRDDVAPQVEPRSPGSRWTSARVRVCRDEPVVLGYPAWVLGDEEGRTAQLSRVLHEQFPQPAFDNASTKTGCQEGWVTFVTPADLTPTRVTFEQTRDVRAPWLIAGA